mgnify:CR=1 FL=1
MVVEAKAVNPSLLRELRQLARSDRLRFTLCLKSLGMSTIGQRKRFEIEMDQLEASLAEALTGTEEVPISVVAAPSSTAEFPVNAAEAVVSCLGVAAQAVGASALQSTPSTLLAAEEVNDVADCTQLPLHRRIARSASATEALPPPVGGFRVLHYPSVFVRKAPHGEIVGRCKAGSIVQPDGEAVDGWLPVRMGRVTGWMLIDGVAIGLGTLLAPEPHPAEMTSYRSLSILHAKLLRDELPPPDRDAQGAMGLAAREYFAGAAAARRGERSGAVERFSRGLRVVRDAGFAERGRLEVALGCGLAQHRVLGGEWVEALLLALGIIERSSLPTHSLHPLVWQAHEVAGVAACGLGLIEMGRRLFGRGVAMADQVCNALIEAGGDAVAIDFAVSSVRVGHAVMREQLAAAESRCASLAADVTLEEEARALSRGCVDVSPTVAAKCYQMVLSKRTSLEGQRELMEAGLLTRDEFASLVNAAPPPAVPPPAAPPSTAPPPTAPPPTVPLDRPLTALERQLLDDAAAGGAGGAGRLMLRSLHRLLSYSAEKEIDALLSRRIATSPGETGGRYRCVPPDRVFTAGLPPLLSTDDVEQLRRERLVAIDGSFPAHVIEQAREQLLEMEASGRLVCTEQQPCNPGERSFDMPLWEEEMVRRLEAQAPALVHCIRSVLTLPRQLAEALQLRLRVPQTVLLASYPPGAYYRRHLDSYAGKDIPRYLTVLLYLGWAPQEGGQLRCHLPTGVRDIEPIPGRVVVFYSQEVEHEVLCSLGRRLALTLWIWDVKPDLKGR